MKIYQNMLLMQEIEKMSMEISDVCFCELDKTWQKENVSSLYTRVYCITSGIGYVCADGKETVLLPGNIYIIPSELTFSYRCDTHMEKYYFHIRITAEEKNDLFSGIKEIITLENRSGEIKTLDAYWKKNNMGSILYIKAFLYGIALEVISGTNVNVPVERYSPQIKRVMSYIEEHLHAKMTVGEIARAFNVSESFLHKVFKRETGISLNKYISQKCLMAAKVKLRLTDMPIKEISDSLGYYDQFYFSRKFSQEFRMSPSAYRRTAGKKTE